MANTIDRWRFKYTARFGIVKHVELPNGTFSSKGEFVESFRRRAARYRVTPQMQQTIQGYSVHTDFVIAINKIAHDSIDFAKDYSDWIVEFNDQEYYIKQIEFNEESVMGYHLITLTSDKNYWKSKLDVVR